MVAVIRRVRRLVPGARQVEVAAHDYDRSGKPDCAWDDPQATQALVSELVIDALVVLEAVGDLGLDDEQAEAVALLTLVADRDVEPSERPGSWRISRRVAKDGVTSTVDPAARHTRKTATAKRDGCKMGSGGTSPRLEGDTRPGGLALGSLIAVQAQLGVVPVVRVQDDQQLSSLVGRRIERCSHRDSRCDRIRVEPPIVVLRGNVG